MGSVICLILGWAGMQESAPTHPFRALRWISACSRKAWVRMLTTDDGGGSPRVCRCRALCVVSIRLSSDCILASNSASLSLVARHFVHPRRLCTKMFLFRFFVLICSKCSSGRVLGRGSVFMGAGLPEGILSPAFDAAIRPQSAAVVTADCNRPEDARWRRVIDAAGSPAPYVASVPQCTRKSLAAVHGLEVAVRCAARTASPRSVGLGNLLVLPAPVGAVGLRLAGL